MTEDYKIRVKPVTTASKTPDSVQIRDSFETPKYAVDLLYPYLRMNRFISVWECSTGNGRIEIPLRDSNIFVLGSDIRKLKEDTVEYNFILDRDVLDSQLPFDCIITNPPYSIKDLFIERAFELKIPFAFLINMDYSAKSISWIKRGCEKLIPNRRIRFITPNIVVRVNAGEGTSYKTVDEIPQILLYKYSSSQFHSGWLTWGFNLGKTETFVDLPIKEMKENIL